jgi:Flp pilus assembly protein TadD
MIVLATLFLAQSYAEQIAPLLFEHCARCHRPGEAAPFSLLTYEDARKHAKQIVTVTKSGYMPPWPPEPGSGDFAGGRRLTPAEIARIEQWSQAGAPPGDLARVKPPQFVEGWQLGEPDLVLKMPQAFNLAVDGGDVFRNFVIPSALKQTRYIRAIELRPGNKRAVHHANVVVDRTRSMRAREGHDGQPGFAGMEIETESDSAGEFEPDSHFLFWKPGNTVVPEPAGMAWPLDPGTDLVVNLHLQPTGKPERIQAVLGLYFDAQPPKHFPILVQLEHDGAIDIPPGSRDFVVSDSFTLPVAADLLAIYPHAHYIGKRIEAWATLPQGRRVPLIEIKDWDINWQASYPYRTPVSLPAGTTVAMRIVYDNSTANPRNPLKPPRRVKTGNRSEDEMGHVWLQLLPKHKEDRLKIHEAVMRRRLQKYPADFVAHYNLGAVMQSTGRIDEALKLMQRATQLRPDSTPARNAYGVSLLLADHIDEAITEFRRIDPAYAPARFNLGRALAAKGDDAGAIREWSAYLRDNDGDGRAHYLLAGVYAGSQRIAEALPHLRRAAELLPDDAEVHANLGTALAISGNAPAAIRAWERALELNPTDAVTRANLQRVKGRQ